MIDISILILRIAVGITMAVHGLDKFQRREELEDKWNQKYGFPKSFVVLNGVLQLMSGGMITIGLFTQVMSMILVIDMVAATWISVTKNEEPFLSSSKGKGWDINFTLILGLLALVFLGEGSLSVAGLFK